jgi:hypothetical protein
MLRYDLHLHSRYSPDGTPGVADVIRIARKRGLDSIAVTDHDTIRGGLEAVERRLGIPSIEEITGGKSWRLGGCGASIRRFATGRIAGMSGCNALFRRSGAPPGGIDPLRFCDNAIRFLG